jgi:hypothetical protein
VFHQVFREENEMENALIPTPAGDDPQETDPRKAGGDRENKAGPQGSEKTRRARPRVPSLEECLTAMHQLAGLVAMGLLKPAQANTIRASFREILQFHMRSARTAEQGISNADVMSVLRKNPGLVNLLAPILTDEQIAMVMKGE